MEDLLTIDYKAGANVMLELPFTFFHWRLIEYFVEVSTDDRVNQAKQLNMFQPEWSNGMVLNILPNLKTLLHFVANNFPLLKFVQT